MSKLSMVALGVATAALVGAVTMTVTRAADAADKAGILIMVEDADSDTVPRDSSIYDGVLSALNEQLTAAGFSVYDEAAVSKSAGARAGNRRTILEILDIARSIKQPPFGFLAVVSIYASGARTSYATKLNLRITNQMLDTARWSRFGNLELEHRANAPPDCTRECMIKSLSGHAGRLAKDLGAKMAERVRKFQARERRR